MSRYWNAKIETKIAKSKSATNEKEKRIFQIKINGISDEDAPFKIKTIRNDELFSSNAIEFLKDLQTTNSKNKTDLKNIEQLWKCAYFGRNKRITLYLIGCEQFNGLLVLDENLYSLMPSTNTNQKQSQLQNYRIELLPSTIKYKTITDTDLFNSDRNRHQSPPKQQQQQEPNEKTNIISLLAKVNKKDELTTTNKFPLLSPPVNAAASSSSSDFTKPVVVKISLYLDKTHLNDLINFDSNNNFIINRYVQSLVLKCHLTWSYYYLEHKIKLKFIKINFVDLKSQLGQSHRPGTSSTSAFSSVSTSSTRNTNIDHQPNGLLEISNSTKTTTKQTNQTNRNQLTDLFEELMNKVSYEEGIERVADASNDDDNDNAIDANGIKNSIEVYMLPKYLFSDLMTTTTTTTSQHVLMYDGIATQQTSQYLLCENPFKRKHMRLSHPNRSLIFIKERFNLIDDDLLKHRQSQSQSQAQAQHHQQQQQQQLNNELSYLNEQQRDKRQINQRSRLIKQTVEQANILIDLIGSNLGNKHNENETLTNVACNDESQLSENEFNWYFQVHSSLNSIASSSSSDSTTNNDSSQTYSSSNEEMQSICLNRVLKLDTECKEASKNGYCGDGVVNSNEECDCGSEGDSSNCRTSCCDMNTCKFRTKEMQCAGGDCCDQNCQLKNSNFICRYAIGTTNNSTNSHSSCDWNEYCDGVNPQCPEDVYYHNGIECNENNEKGHCWNGRCISSNLQCKSLWSDGSTSSDNSCYTSFNTIGFDNGNCGVLNSSAVNTQSPPPPGQPKLYKPCSTQDAQCGLLNCQLGNEQPLIKSESYFKSMTSIKGKKYECKVITSQPSVYVNDGSKCEWETPNGETNVGVCVSKKCIRLTDIIKETNTKCLNSSNLSSSTRHSSSSLVSSLELCSNNGICTNKNECRCFDNWSGVYCDKYLKRPELNSSLSTNSVMKSSLNNLYKSSNQTNEKMRSTTIGNLKSTTTLFSIIGAVSSLFLILFLISFIFCRRRHNRRRSTQQRNKLKQKNLINQNGTDQLDAQNVKSLIDFDNDYKLLGKQDTQTGIISFGQMPIYKDKYRQNSFEFDRTSMTPTSATTPTAIATTTTTTTATTTTTNSKRQNNVSLFSSFKIFSSNKEKSFGACNSSNSYGSYSISSINSQQNIENSSFMNSSQNGCNLSLTKVNQAIQQLSTQPAKSILKKVSDQNAAGIGATIATSGTSAAITSSLTSSNINNFNKHSHGSNSPTPILATSLANLNQSKHSTVNESIDNTVDSSLRFERQVNINTMINSVVGTGHRTSRRSLTYNDNKRASLCSISSSSSSSSISSSSSVSSQSSISISSSLSKSKFNSKKSKNFTKQDSSGNTKSSCPYLKKQIYEELNNSLKMNAGLKMDSGKDICPISLSGSGGGGVKGALVVSDKKNNANLSFLTSSSSSASSRSSSSISLALLEPKSIQLKAAAAAANDLKTNEQKSDYLKVQDYLNELNILSKQNTFAASNNNPTIGIANINKTSNSNQKMLNSVNTNGGGIMKLQMDSKTNCISNQLYETHSASQQTPTILKENDLAYLNNLITPELHSSPIKPYSLLFHNKNNIKLLENNDQQTNETPQRPSSLLTPILANKIAENKIQRQQTTTDMDYNIYSMSCKQSNNTTTNEQLQQQQQQKNRLSLLSSPQHNQMLHLQILKQQNCQLNEDMTNLHTNNSETSSGYLSTSTSNINQQQMVNKNTNQNLKQSVKVPNDQIYMKEKCAQYTNGLIGKDIYMNGVDDLKEENNGGSHESLFETDDYYSIEKKPISLPRVGGKLLNGCASLIGQTNVNKCANTSIEGSSDSSNTKTSSLSSNESQSSSRSSSAFNSTPPPPNLFNLSATNTTNTANSQIDKRFSYILATGSTNNLNIDP